MRSKPLSTTRPATPRRVQGFTLIELLMVIAIIGILAALIFPAVNMVRTMAYQAQSANNLKQIMLGMKIYSEQSDNAFPALTARGSIPANPYLETLGAFEVLAAFSAGEMTGKVFKCPVAEVATITIQPLPGGTAWTAQKVSYAFDWSAPATKSTAGRVILGDRDPDNWKGKGINVAFGDTSVRFLQCVTSVTSSGTFAQNDNNDAAVTGSPLNVDMGSDNVLCLESADTTAASVLMTKVGKGSATRCALR